MAKTKTVKPKAPKLVLSEEARATLGEVRTFEALPPSTRSRYPWDQVHEGECFNIPIGSRSGVGKKGKQFGRTFRVVDNKDGTATVYCTGVAANPRME